MEKPFNSPKKMQPLHGLVIKEFEIKVQAVLLQLKTFSETPIEDDTVYKKLESCLCKLIQEKENQLIWSNYIGLITFIRDVLEENYVKNDKNSYAVSFALHCFATLLKKEENFFYLSDHKSIQNFIAAFPVLRSNNYLSVPSLTVVSAIISHPSGSAWALENKIWENLLIPCLKSSSIYVQRECIHVITELLLQTPDDKTFSNYVRDLELILYKFRETRVKLKQMCEAGELDGDKRASAEANMALMRFNTYTILLIFYHLLLKTLGKRSIYSRLKPVLDLSSKILFIFNFDISSESVLKLSRLLLLSTIHRFQDQLLKFGTAEQFHLDSVISDLLSLCRHMINKGHIKEFLLASFDIHKHWRIMCRNISDQTDAELSKCESILLVMLRFQLVPLRVICSTALEFADEEEKKTLQADVAKWDEEIFAKMSIRNEQKDEVGRLETLINDRLVDDVPAADMHCIACLTRCLSILDSFHPTCAVILFQGLTFLIKFQFKMATRIDTNPRLLQVTIDVLQTLIEKYDIDWTKCYESNSVLSLLSEVIWIPCANVRVKVGTLQAISTCISRFMPPVMVSLLNIDRVEDCGIERLGSSLSIYLSDTEWEVRDSTLELICVCMKLAKDKYPFFVDWFERHRLLDTVLQALGDTEPYVQASAVDVIADLVYFDNIWCKIENRGVKEISLRSVIRAGDNSIRKAGINLTSSLFSHSRYSESETTTMVIPVIQYATNDQSDEIRLAALKFIRCYIDTELASAGMVDGEFPAITFHKRKIMKLDEEDIQSRVLGVVCCICENGFIRSVLDCSKDNATEVAEEATEILTYISSLIGKYSLHSRLKDCLESHSTVSNISHDESSQESEEDIQMSDNQITKEYKEAVMESVLDMLDIDAISKLKKTSFESLDTWWSCTSGERGLSMKELPSQFPPVSYRTLFTELEKIACAKLEKPKSLSETVEDEIVDLLEDILIDSGSAEKEEKQKDCY